jgi:hypothetical protein
MTEVNLVGVPLDTTRQNNLEKILPEKVKSNLIRDLFDVRAINQGEALGDFVKLGVNSITNKEYWVADCGDGTTRVYSPIIDNYADSVERGEFEYIITQIKSKISSDRNDFSNPYNLKDKILAAISKVTNPTTILTGNPKDFYKLFPNMFEFNQGRKLQGTLKISPYLKLDIYFMPNLSRDMFLVLNAKQVGVLLIKKPITASINEIDSSEKPKLKSLLGLTDEQLNNRVRISIEEVISFKVISEQYAFAVYLSGVEQL